MYDLLLRLYQSNGKLDCDFKSIKTRLNAKIYFTAETLNCVIMPLHKSKCRNNVGINHIVSL